MDILCNGSEEERHQFSFRLMDERNRGVIEYQEFQNYFTKVIKHWSSLVNKQIKVNKPLLTSIFQQLDLKQNGRVSCR